MNILGAIKTYAWGKKGIESKVAEIASLNSSAFHVNSDETYAELWMGDHISGPSLDAETTLPLNEMFSKNTKLIGDREKLTFLFKVLSIGKALSVQLHPNKEEAKKLHQDRPDLYKDDNHKPEMAIALTPFLALCGFRPTEEIYKLLKAYQPLVDFIGLENIEQIHTDAENGLKTCFSKVMRSTSDDLSICTSRLNDLFKSSESNDLLVKVFLKLNEDFPNDVGILCPFFLNIIQLNPGQAMFLPAKVPHAYISGDCIECMACSDNVVRAGLTPKFRDVDALLEMVSYACEPGDRKIFTPKFLDEYTQLFAPPIEDFAICKIEVPASIEKEHIIKNSPSGSIIIVLSGEANGFRSESSASPLVLKMGSIIFLSALSKELRIQNCNSNEDFVAYQAMYNDYFEK